MRLRGGLKNIPRLQVRLGWLFLFALLIAWVSAAKGTSLEQVALISLALAVAAPIAVWTARQPLAGNAGVAHSIANSVLGVLMLLGLFGSLLREWLIGNRDAIATVVTYFVLLVILLIGPLLIVLVTVSVAKSLLRERPSEPMRLLSTVLLSYLGLVVFMALLFAQMERYSAGGAFRGLLPGELIQDGSGQRTALDMSRRPLALEVDSLYFSVITAATVGYGDIYPLSLPARIAVVFHVLASQFVLLVILGVVLSSARDHPSHSERAAEQGDAPDEVRDGNTNRGPRR